VLILDEPTTGLDVRSRQQMWEVIRELVSAGATLLLTTQYLEEADQLADDIVVIDHGREIAHGTSDHLKTEVGGERLEVTVSEYTHVDTAHEILSSFAVGEIHIDYHGRGLTAPISGGASVLTQALRDLDARGVVVQDVGLRRPTLDDVFLALTGHAAEADDPAEQSGKTEKGQEVPA
jgi:ABC-2 type transport system ATP-binding protein